ncbi:MAG: methyltransferase [Anaerohalosphaeraceae bacterium]|nr:methyltransferase [Anaerohalosphaeraceae bacterium]
MTNSVFKNLYERMNKMYPVYAPLWMESLEQFGEQWEEEISLNISRVFGSEYNERWDEAISGYAEFCTEALRAQCYFEKTGAYKATSYEETVEECYHSADYMKKRYLPGQYLSHYIWPHHQKMLRRFINNLLPQIMQNVSLFYEVGVGCGMYSQWALNTIPKACGIGYDISDYALEFTLRVAKSHGYGERYKIINQNIIDEPIERKADLVISQEVLEHLDKPQLFIDSLYSAVRSGGWGYITAAINAAHTDHIYLYRSPEEVQQQLENAGWQICDTQIESNYPQKPIEKRPTIVGFLVRKQD